MRKVDKENEINSFRTMILMLIHYSFTSCENSPDNMTVLVDCSGKILCAIGGYAGKKDTIYNIDGNSIETIYSNY